LVRNIIQFHKCAFANLSDRLYRISTEKPGNYCIKASSELRKGGTEISRSIFNECSGMGTDFAGRARIAGRAHGCPEVIKGPRSPRACRTPARKSLDSFKAIESRPSVEPQSGCLFSRSCHALIVRATSARTLGRR